jgi:hypothetical protein
VHLLVNITETQTKKSDDVVQLKSVVVVVVIVVRTRDCKFKSKPTNAHDN